MKHIFQSQAAMNGTTKSSFEELLQQLAAVHSQQVNAIQKDCDDKIRVFKDEIASLHTRLGQAGSLSADDVDFVMLMDGKDGEDKGPDDAVVNPLEAKEDMTGGNKFEIKKDWTRKLESNTWGKRLDTLMLRCGRPGDITVHADPSSLDHHELEVPAKVERKAFIINPTTNFRLVWDLCSLVLITYDLFTIPFIQAFQPPPSILSETMDWAALLFWTGDMLQGFFLGYYEKGMYVENHRKVFIHYLKSWFLIDTVVVVPEWVILAAGSFLSSEGDQVNAVAKFFKGARAIRVLRLLRLLKLQRIMNILYDLIENEWTFIVLNLTKMLLFVVVLNHVIACLWFLIGRLSMEQDVRNWIEVGNVNGTELAYSYTTSLHWSLTQFTPASMDISARNTLERIYSIIVLFFALVTFSSIVASITGSTTSLRNMKSDEMKQFWLLRRFLRQRSVSNELSNRIFKFLEHNLKIQSKLVQRDSIKILSGLSEALNMEMTHQINSPHLLKHPLFLHIDSNMKAVIWRICRHVLKPQAYAEKETVFSWGDVAKHMYFIKGGHFIYMSADGVQHMPGPKDWVSEAVLWTNWRHQGDFIAEENSEMLSVDPQPFLDVMAVHPRSWFFAKEYAALFVDMLNRIPRLALSDIIRDPQFYADAVRDSEAIFNCKEKTKTLIRSSLTIPGDQEAEHAPDDTEPEAMSETDMPVADTQPRTLRLCPCSRGVPMCLS